MEERAAAPGFHSMNGMQHQPAFFTQRLRSNNKKIKNKKRNVQPHCAEREISHWSQVKQKKKTALYTAETAKAGRPKLDAVLSLMQVETVKVHQGEIPTSPTITSRNKTVDGGELSLSLSK